MLIYIYKHKVYMHIQMYIHMHSWVSTFNSMVSRQTLEVASICLKAGYFKQL